MEKYVFLLKKHVFGFVVEMGGRPLKPYILQRFRRMCLVKKIVIFGPSWAPPDTKGALVRERLRF